MRWKDIFLPSNLEEEAQPPPRFRSNRPPPQKWSFWGFEVCELLCFFCFFQHFCQQSFTHPPREAGAWIRFCSVAAGNNEAGTWHNGIVSERRSESAEGWRCICVCCAFGQKGARQSRSDWTNAAHLIPQVESPPPVGPSARHKDWSCADVSCAGVCLSSARGRGRQRKHTCLIVIVVDLLVSSSLISCWGVKFSLSCTCDWLSHCQVF